MDDQQPVTPPADDFKVKYDEATLGWKRALADYDNLKKDLSRERGEMRRDAAARAAESFLGVLDNFDAAVKFTPENVDPKLQGWLSGILFIRTQLETALRDLGLEPFGAVGDSFNANLHEAVTERELPLTKRETLQPEGVAPVILEVIRRGWKIGDRIVRGASVVVSK